MKLLFFTASFCVPCANLKPVAKDLSTAYPHVPIKILEIDTDTDAEALASHYNVRAVPTLIIVDDNCAEVRRLVGNQSRATLETWILEEK